MTIFDERFDHVIEVLESAIENLRDPELRADAGAVWQQAASVRIEARLIAQIAIAMDPELPVKMGQP